MNYAYVLTPLVTWLAAGSLKFVINSIKAKRWAFGQIGYGGCPSNHSALVSSMAALIAFKEGVGHPAFGVALTVAVIVMFDAYTLRRQVGRHAVAINKLAAQDSQHQALRERMGHTRLEIAAGMVLGIAVAAGVNALVGA